ncbi:hypothetical protein [Bythopirellula polymerisocia]|uniref:Uncharacterized protein n=1 Tax=Bythopirellula polymerisocia TaxID=2528003 RepID=A0A5C6CYJ2_9BACT|nr:hypothetical protein [Bythopirellula polymerisocia]TWU28607.1 hypothetical protein Pla144_18980 [Bythopirellula polymerisocia]
MDVEPTTKHTLQGRELIEYLIEKTANSTNAVLIEREDRRNRRSTILFSIITFIGISGLVGAARLFIDHAVQQRTSEFQNEMVRNSEQLERRIASMHLESQALQKLLTDQIEALTKGIERQVKQQVAEEASRGLLTLKHREQYHALKQFVEEIEQQVAENEFPENLLTAAVDTANQLADADEISSEPLFQPMIEKLVDLLVRSDRVKDINRVEQATRTTCVRSKRIALDLTDHYGQLIISSPYPVEQLNAEFEALTRYARASRELKYPEKSIMWELFVEYKRNRYSKSPTTDEIVEMVYSLNAADLRNFCYHVFLNSHPLHWMNTPDHEGQMLAKLVANLLGDYPELRSTVEAQIATPELRAIVEEVVTTKQERQKRLAENQPKTETPEATEIPNTAREPDGDENELRR